MKWPFHNLTRWELCCIFLPLLVAVSALSFVVGRASAFGRWFLFLLAILLPCGCQQRETNLALQQADQAVEGGQAIISERIAPLVAGLPPEIHAAITAALDDVVLLMTSSRESLRPALALTAGDEPAPESRTTVRLAVEHPQEFARVAAVQTGRAHAEVDDYLRWVSFASFAAQWAAAAGGSLASQLLMGGGAAGLLTSLAALWKTARTARSQIQVLKRTVVDAVTHGEEMEEAETEDDVKAVKKRSVDRQVANGTRPVIKQILDGKVVPA